MYVSTRLGRLWVEERGRLRRDGDATIVLWHSFLCDGGMWDDVVPALADLGRVLVFDGPGHGKSDVPPRSDLEDHARALVDALDALGADRVVMAGLSWGGMVGMRLARLAPQRVNALALLDTSADPERRRHRVQYAAMLALFQRVGVPRWLTERRIGPLMFAPHTLRARPELVLRVHREVSGFPRLGVARVGRAIFGRPSFVSELASIFAPTLVICGRQDRATPLSRSRRIADRIPRATLSVLEDVGHLSAMEAPAAVSALLAPFVGAHLA